MGREISYLCDACGRDCTDDYYVVSVVRQIGQATRFRVKGDDPILCPACFVSLLSGFLSSMPESEWETDDEEEFSF